MRTWQQLREHDIRDELLDDQYGLVGNRDSAGTDYPDSVVFSLGFIKELATRHPEIQAILDEEMALLEVFQPKSTCKIDIPVFRGRQGWGK